MGEFVFFPRTVVDSDHELTCITRRVTQYDAFPKNKFQYQKQAHNFKGAFETLA